MNEFSDHNHVILSLSSWGRGRTLIEAAKAAGVDPDRDTFMYHVFTDDSWDLVAGESMITYPVDSLVQKTEFKRGEIVKHFIPTMIKSKS